MLVYVEITSRLLLCLLLFSEGPFSFQAQLHSDGKIVFAYKNVSAHQILLLSLHKVT